MKIIGCQFDIAWEDKAENYRRVLDLLRPGGIEPDSLLVLPEMFATGFSMDVATIAEEPGGETEVFLQSIATDNRCMVVGGVVVHGADGKGRNEALVVGPTGRVIARYCKMYPFRLGGETASYEPGNQVTLFDYAGFTVAPLICYDLRFPEVFRAAVTRGANLFLVIANWPQVREEHWITLLRARAIENQAYVVGVNRCGSDPGLIYSGRSLVVGPRGELIADGGNVPGLLRADADLKTLVNYRHQFPALDDIRTDMFVHP